MASIIFVGLRVASHLIAGQVIVKIQRMKRMAAAPRWKDDPFELRTTGNGKAPKLLTNAWTADQAPAEVCG
jgi:hypothetical protein